MGFDWQDAGQVYQKIEEELAELQEVLGSEGQQARQEEELGDLLFTVVNLARHLNVQCRRGPAEKFRQICSPFQAC